MATHARFCGACGTEIGAPPVLSARKVISVVFGDLVASTTLQESLDPESARRLMARFYDLMHAVITRHEGQLHRFVGDGVVAVFGVPLIGEDDALRAVRCAATMVTELAKLSEDLAQNWGVRLRMRTGVNTGELVIGEQGELVGDAMNTAARLESAAAPGEVLVGEATWRLVRRRMQLAPVGLLALKGKSAPVPAWRLLDAEPAPEESARGRFEVPLVGRTAELDRLRASLTAAVDADGCRLVTVISSPGVGKSRLADEFALAVAPDAMVVQGRCDPSGEGITFGPVADMLRGACGIGETDSPEIVRAKLTALVEGEAEADRIVERAGSLLGSANPASVQETFWGIRRILEALAQRRPLVVILEDLHWAQPMFLDLVEHLAEWVCQAPILLLALGRPELREVRAVLCAASGGRAFEVVELAPLAWDESRAFVDGMLGAVELPPGLLERILDTTGGNPLFLGETLRMLVDEGSLARQGETWVAAGTGPVEVPPTIQALLSARIERLRHEERAVVERAAVIGKQFYRGAVAELVAPLVRSGLDGHLESLRRKEFVEPDGSDWVNEPIYRFHHVLLRDAAYGFLLKEVRADLHERFADWLTAKAGELVGEHEEVIAYHLEQAHDYRRQLGPLDADSRALGVRAAMLLAAVGRRALARSDLPAAANLLGRARERTEGDDAELVWDLAETLLLAGDTTAAREVVEHLGALAGQDSRLRARADVLTGQIAVLAGASPPKAIIENLVRAADELATAGDTPGSSKAHHVIAQANVQLGRLGDAEAALDRALLAARQAGDSRRITAVLAAAPRAALWGPSPVVQSSGHCLDVLRVLRMTPGNRHLEAIALRCLAVLDAVRGRFGPARDMLDTARAALSELGLSWELLELAAHAGMVELLAGAPAAAEGYLSSAREGFTALGADTGAAQAAALLARALVEQGRDDEALEQTRFAERYAGGDLKTTITWCGVRAEALGRFGDHDEALALASRAVALAEPTDALADKADAHLALAHVQRILGHADEARTEADTARELYKAKGHVVGMARATEFAGTPTVTRPEKPRPTGILGDRAPERTITRWFQCVNNHDADALPGMFAEDIVRVDHRKLGWADIHGRDGLREHYRSGENVWSDVRCNADEVLALDDRIIAFTWTMHATTDAGSVCEISLGVVAVVEDGLLTRWDQYEPDDRPAMIAGFVDLGGGQGILGERPSEQVVREVSCRLARRDMDWVLELLSDDFVLVEHREPGWTETDKAGLQRLHESMFENALYLHNDCDELLASDDRVIATIQVWRGRSADGGEILEIPYGVVMVVEDGRAIRMEHFDPTDRGRILARYAELGGRSEVAQRPPPKRR